MTTEKGASQTCGARSQGPDGKVVTCYGNPHDGLHFDYVVRWWWPERADPEASS